MLIQRYKLYFHLSNVFGKIPTYVEKCTVCFHILIVIFVDTNGANLQIEGLIQLADHKIDEQQNPTTDCRKKPPKERVKDAP